MYSVQTTPGFIIDSRPFGEAGKLLSIFTRDLGLILATAQGIRLEKSKLRYHSQEYSFGTYSFIRGKEFWRLTSAQGEAIQKNPQGIDSSRPLYIFFARIALLLRRLLHGEQAHPELFEIIKESATYFYSQPNFSEEDSKTLESITVYKILHALGYIGNNSSLEFIHAHIYSPEFLALSREHRVDIVQAINKALRESHL